MPLATAISSLGGIVTNAMNIRAQKQMNNLNWQRQQQMIEDERKYNDPSAVMERYEKAGINTTFAGMNPSINGGSDVGAQAPVQGIAPQMQNPLADVATNLSAEAGARSVNADAKLKEDTMQANVERATAELESIRSTTKYNLANVTKIAFENGLISAQSYKTLIECNKVASETKFQNLLNRWQELANKPQEFKNFYYEKIEGILNNSDEFKDLSDEEKDKILAIALPEVMAIRQAFVDMENTKQDTSLKAEAEKTEKTKQQLNQSASALNAAQTAESNARTTALKQENKMREDFMSVIMTGVLPDGSKIRPSYWEQLNSKFGNSEEMRTYEYRIRQLNVELMGLEYDIRNSDAFRHQSDDHFDRTNSREWINTGSNMVKIALGKK